MRIYLRFTSGVLACGEYPAEGALIPFAEAPGHGVAVLLKIYAHCIDGQADAANKRITDALGAQDAQTESEPGKEGDDDIEQAS